MAQSQEITVTPAYDRINMPSAGTGTDYPFFVVPKGSSDPNAGPVGQKTYIDTNMTAAGRFGKPESFLVKRIALIFDFTTKEADIAIVLNHSILEFHGQNGEITAWRAPSLLVPAACGFPWTNNNTSQAQNGLPTPMADYELEIPYLIDIEEQFDVTMKWDKAPSALAGGTGLSVSALGVRCVLKGYRALVSDAKDPVSGKELSPLRNLAEPRFLLGLQQAA